MTILLVGAGLIGSQIVKIELEKGERPVILDASPRPEALGDIFDVSKVKIIRGDVLNPHDIYSAIKQEGITKIIHTAANPLLTVGAQKDPYRAVQLNVMGTMNVLEAARTLDLERVVFTSSNVIEQFAKQAPDGRIRPSTVYSSTKLACENLGLVYFQSYGLDFVAVRFSAVIGPWRYGGGGGPTQRFQELIDKSLKGEPVSYPLSPQEYVYSKDAANGCVLASTSDKLKKRIYDISMGKACTGTEVKEAVEKVLPGAKIELTSTTGPGIASDKTIKEADTAGAKDELGYEPQYNIGRAVQDYVSFKKGIL